MKRQNQSVGKIILVYFFKTIGIMALLVGVGLLSYYLTMLYFRQTDKAERSAAYTHVIPVSAGTESSNLIYAYDDKTGKIEAMILELFDQNSKNMTYVTIPANTRITISKRTYSELIKVNSTLPQVVTMSDVQSYFSGDVAYEYGILILQEALPVEIGYFTAMPSNKFEVYYEFGAKKDECYNPTTAFLTSMKKCDSKSSMEDMIEDLWDEQISDLTLSQKLNYAEALSQVKWDFVHIYAAYGNTEGEAFSINGKKTKKLVSRIWESEPYTKAQFDAGGNEDDETAEEQQNIEILNGSAIDGLASDYQKQMQADGLSVVNIGNYTGMKQESTTIYAKNVKWAKKNLRSYFPKPKKVKVEPATELDEGIDVMIVLGTDAKR